MKIRKIFAISMKEKRLLFLVQIQIANTQKICSYSLRDKNRHFMRLSSIKLTKFCLLFIFTASRTVQRGKFSQNGGKPSGSKYSCVTWFRISLANYSKDAMKH